MTRNRATSTRKAPVSMPGPFFARHETFHPRHNWLKKGFDAACRDPDVFTDSDAHVKLGVGKNMVRSIRYWCHAFKLLEDAPKANRRTVASRPSAFGRLLLGSNGLDPYLEDTGSLWLLHWQLLRGSCLATAWWYAFFVHTRSDLSVETLTAGLSEYVDRQFPAARVAISSLRKDASCIIRMYGELLTGAAVNEESIHCPFAELELIRPGIDPKTYTFRIGPKPGLSSPLIAAACLQYAGGADGGSAQTISLARLLHQPGSPGAAFKLSENALYSALEEVCESQQNLNLSDTGGIVQLSFAKPAAKLSQALILEHFRHTRRLEVVA